MMPTTMPSTVNALRNLFERSEPRAIRTVSVGKIFESTCFIDQFFVIATMGSRRDAFHAG
jgi:hypothetical protein